MTDAGTNITLTFTEAIKKDSDGADFAIADLSGILTLKTTSVSGTDIPYAASINAAKTVITINPTSNLADGDVYVAVSNGYYGASGNQGVAVNATFTVAAPPSTKTYTIDSAATANEGANAELTITLGENAPTANLAFTVTPTYDSGTGKAVAADLGTVPTSVTVASGSTTATLSIPIARDADEEGSETFSVAIAPATATGWEVASDGTASATVTITDTTEAVSFAAATYAVDEGESVSVTVSRTGSTAEPLEVTVSTTDGTAGSADYTALNSKTVTIAAGSATANVAIATTDDDVDEGDGETLTVTLAAPAADSGYRLGTQSSATVTITDDDDAGVTVSDESLSVTAGQTATYTVVLTSKPTHSVTITPTSGTPANATVGAAVVFTTTNWQTPQMVTVTGVQAGNATITHAASSTDTKYQSSLGIDSVAVTVAAAAPSTKTYKISSAVTAAEGEDAELTITLGENAPTANLAFTVTPTYDNGTGKAVAADVGTVPTSITVASGSTTATLSIPIARDADEEGSETFSVAIEPTTATGWTVASDGTASATVTITDTTEAVSFAAATYTVDEGGSATVVVSRTGSTAEALEVTVSTTDGTAGSADYTALNSKTVTIAAGSATANVSIQTTDDEVDEGTGETFTVTIAAPAADTGYRLGTQSSATVTITDDDDAGVTVSKSSLGVTAGESATYTVVLTSKPTHSVTITPTSGTPANATVGAAVVFTTSNWSTPKEITVTGVQAGSATITHAASSTDTHYQSSLSIGEVAVTVAAADTTGPAAPAFDPADGVTVTDAATNITLTFAEAIKKDSDGADFANADLASILTLKTTSVSGTDIPYAASINTAKTVITINPTSNLADGNVYVAVTDGYYDANGNQGEAANATFTVDATGPAAPTFDPVAGATVTDAATNITLTFAEAIRKDQRRRRLR